MATQSSRSHARYVSGSHEVGYPAGWGVSDVPWAYYYQQGGYEGAAKGAAGNYSVVDKGINNPYEFSFGDQYYSNIVGRDEYSHFGRGLDIDFEGHRIVGGGPQYSSGTGYIGVYDWNDTTKNWDRVGNYVDGPNTGGWFGESVSMDYDGQRIIVGAPKSNSGAGSVHVLDFNGTNFVITHNISAPTGASGFGHCVSIAGDKADRFVVGAPNVNTIYVYEYLSSTWTQTYSNVGTDSAIVNDVNLDNNGNMLTLFPEYNGYGHSVDMSGFGEHIVVGAPGTPTLQLKGGTSPGQIDHNLGEHATNSVGPHYNSSQSTGRSNSGGWNTLTYRGGEGISASHPYSAAGQSYNTIQYTDKNNKLWADRLSPHGYNASGYPDSHAYPNWQIGNIRVLGCPDGGSWSNGVTQIGDVIKGRLVEPGPNYDSKHRNNLNDWDSNSYQCFPAFGKVVTISADGSRVSASAPYFRHVHMYEGVTQTGDVRYFIYDNDTGKYNEPMVINEANADIEYIGPPAPFQLGNSLSMTEDGSRVFPGGGDSVYSVSPFDFSGKTMYPASPLTLVKDNNYSKFSKLGPLTGAGSSPNTTIEEHRGYLSGYKTASKSGKMVAWSSPAFPEAYGARSSGGNNGSNTTAATSNNQGRGIVLIYKHSLTGVVRGNSIFEGYLKCDDFTIGSSTASLRAAKLKFGGRLGEAGSEAITTIENRWLGARNDYYTPLADGPGDIPYKHDNELLISKWISPLNAPPDVVKYITHNEPANNRNDRHWTKREFFGERIRLKAPKIEFHLQTKASEFHATSKYTEHPVVTITDHHARDWSWGKGARGFGDDGATAAVQLTHYELRHLMTFRTGTCNSRVNAGIRLVAAKSPVPYGLGGDSQKQRTPEDGAHYTFAPGLDGWLRLLHEDRLEDPDPSGNKQNNCHFAYWDPSGSTTENWGGSSSFDYNKIMYAGLAVGYLWVGSGSVQYPSDDRLKHFEEEIPDCLDLINQLNPYKYKKTQGKYTEDYTGDIGIENKNWNWEIGLIAQDIKKIPYLEFAVKDPDPSAGDVYSLNYNNFIGVCIQGIKDLHNRHQPEIAKVATLQSDLTIERENVETLQTDLTTLQSDVAVEREKVATLQSDLTVEKEKVATLQSDLTIEKEKVATLQTDVDREKLKTLNLQERILVMEQAYHALLERVSDLENS